MPLFKRKKKESEPAPEVSVEISPADLPDEDFRNYISEREAAPYDEDGYYDEPLTDEEEEEAEESEAEAEQDQEADAEPEETPPFRSFATEDEYNSAVKQAIDEARKQWDIDNEAVIKRAQRMAQIADAYFPDDDNSFDSLANDLEAQYEERAGRPFSEYLSESKRNDSAAKWDAQEKEKSDHDGKKQAIIDKWVADSGNLKVIEPDFDLEEALKNKAFTDVLLSGGDVFSAYATAYKGDPDPEPEPEPEKDKRQPVQQVGALKSRSSGDRRRDPSKMSDKDFKKYISDIKNG